MEQREETKLPKIETQEVMKVFRNNEAMVRNAKMD